LKESPREAYARRLEDRTRELARLEREHGRTSRIRGAVFLLGIALAYASLDRGVFSPIWLILPVAAFVALVLRHARLGAERDRAELAAQFHRRGLARLDGTWRTHGPTGEAALAIRGGAAHDYAIDLDIVGKGSLFALVCTAATPGGRDTLARWLLAPAERDEVLERQAAVAELAPRLDEREALWVAAGDPEAATDPGPLVRWGRPGDDLAPTWIAAAAGGLALLAVLSLVALPFGILQPATFMTVVAAEVAFLAFLRGRLAETTRGLDRRVGELRRLASMLEQIEQGSFTAPRLVALRERLRSGPAPASTHIRNLRRLLELYDSGGNLLFLPVALLILWPILTGHAIARWRRRNGPEIEHWLGAISEIEATASLAAHTFDHPDDVFPTFAVEGPCYDATGLAHPLLAEENLVRNDVRLDRECPGWIVSGSNMSGKSTLLRAVGVNAVLAFAGGTVRAHRLALSELAVGASIRIEDSLLDGRSRFQAEIVRMRQLVDLAEGARPLLFLLDEVFAGTNSHDRRVGAEHVLIGLLARGAIGLVTTHDLALAQIGDGPTRLRNVHFEEHLEGEQMTFDYRLLPGVVRTSNALALMRAIGLEVPPE
jgi:hypothetical protein